MELRAPEPVRRQFGNPSPIWKQDTRIRNSLGVFLLSLLLLFGGYRAGLFEAPPPLRPQVRELPGKAFFFGIEGEVRRDGKVEVREDISFHRSTPGDIALRRWYPATVDARWLSDSADTPKEGVQQSPPAAQSIQYQALRAERLPELAGAQPIHYSDIQAQLQNGRAIFTLKRDGEIMKAGNYTFIFKYRAENLVVQDERAGLEGVRFTVLDRLGVPTSYSQISLRLPDFVPADSTRCALVIGDERTKCDVRKGPIDDAELKSRPTTAFLTTSQDEKEVFVRGAVNKELPHNERVLLEVSWPIGFVHPEGRTLRLSDDGKGQR